MADRCDFFFKQLVQENELDLAFDQLEQADHNLAADIGLFGIVSGAFPVPHEPVPNLTIDLTAPGRSYDRLGQRVFFGTDQSVNCAVDYTGIPTEVSQAGNERWLGVFLKFDRLLSDPRTDGNSQQVYFRRDEHFQILVRQGAEASGGSAQKVPLQEDEILVCDIRRTAGQTQIAEADIDQFRRQAFVFSTGSAVEIDPRTWDHISPSLNTVQAAFDSADRVFDDHFTGGLTRHKARDVTFRPFSFIVSDTMQAATNELLAKLVADNSVAPGAIRIGSKEMPGTPVSLSIGTVDSHITELLAAINDHWNAKEDIHPADGISVADSQHRLDAKHVEDALQEILEAFEAGHYRSNQFNGGRHRAIRQPDLGSGRVLCLHSLGSGGVSAQFRIYADSSSIWFTMNAEWKESNSLWEKDSPGQSGGFRFGRNAFEFLFDDSSGNFSKWGTRWLLPMGLATNSSFEVYGDIREVGRLGLHTTNSYSSSQTVSTGSAVTFRVRFPAVPSSITLSVSETGGGFAGEPNVFSPNRDGFCFKTYQYVGSNVSVFWYGSYIAIA